MRIVIGADQNGLELKNILFDYVKEKGIFIEDAGVYTKDPVDYPDVAYKVSQAIVKGEYDRGILICGTGIGMAIVANKIPGIRAAQCSDPYSAQRAIKSNNAQIMTMGALVVGEAVAKKLVDIWLSCEFDPACPSSKKVDKINRIDCETKKK